MYARTLFKCRSLRMIWLWKWLCQTGVFGVSRSVFIFWVTDDLNPETRVESERFCRWEGVRGIHAPLQQIPAGAVNVFPTVAFFDDGLEVFLPDHLVLHRVFDDRA